MQTLVIIILSSSLNLHRLLAPGVEMVYVQMSVMCSIQYKIVGEYGWEQEISTFHVSMYFGTYSIIYFKDNFKLICAMGYGYRRGVDF